MSGEQWGEAVDAVKDFSWWNYGLDEVSETQSDDWAHALIAKVAPLIVADTRRKDDAVLLDVVMHHRPGPDACACGYDDGGHGAHVIDRYRTARAIARGSGNGDSGQEGT